MAGTVEQIRAADLARQMTITFKVTGLKVFRARLALASLVFRLGALIAGVSIEITGA